MVEGTLSKQDERDVERLGKAAGSSPQQQVGVPFPRPSRSRALSNYFEEGVQTEINNTLGRTTLRDYGTSRFDRASTYEGRLDPDLRAKNQSDALKILAGAGKMGVVMGTTYVDDIAGTIAGLANIGLDWYNASQTYKQTGNEEDRYSWAKAGNSFVTNPISSYMNDLRELSETWMPNYYTQAEINDDGKWWTHINANTIGDQFLKNIGFTLGTVLGGVRIGSWLRRAGDRNNMRNVFKGMASKNIESTGLSEIANGAKINREQLLKNLRTEGAATAGRGVVENGVTAMLASMGESRMEAINAANEFRENQMAKLNDAYNTIIGNVDAEILNEHGPDSDEPWFDAFDEADAGESSHVVPIIKPEYIEAYAAERDRKIAEASQKYTGYMQAIEDQTMDISNATFIANMAVLTPSTMFQFGKLLSGGYSTARRFGKAVTGSIAKGYKARGSRAGSIIRGIANPLSEGAEEGAQKIISEAAKDYADTNMAAFNNRRYDESVIDDWGEKLHTILESAGETISDPETWFEVIMGVATGAMSMPAMSNGRVQFGGGIYGGIRDANQEYSRREALAEELNSHLSPDFKNMFGTMIATQSYENDMSKAALAGDHYGYENARLKELIEVVSSFTEAGRVQDLRDLAHVFSNISDEDFEALKELSQNKDGSPSKLDRIDPNMAKEDFKKKAEEMDDTIDLVAKADASLRSRYGSDADSGAIREMLRTTVMIDKLEERFGKMVQEIIDVLPKFTSRINLVDAEGKTLPEKEQQAQKRLIVEAPLYRDIYTNGQLIDNRKEILGYLDALDEQARKLSKKTDTEEIREKIQDAAKVYDLRKSYIDKLAGLEAVPHNYSQDEVSPKRYSNKVNRRQRKAWMDEAKSFTSVKQVRDALNDETLSDAARDMRSASVQELAKTVPAFASYRDIHLAAQDIISSLDKKLDSQVIADASMMINAKEATAESPQDMFEDSVMSSEEFEQMLPEADRVDKAVVDDRYNKAVDALLKDNTGAIAKAKEENKKTGGSEYSSKKHESAPPKKKTESPEDEYTPSALEMMDDGNADFVFSGPPSSGVGEDIGVDGPAKSTVVRDAADLEPAEPERPDSTMFSLAMPEDEFRKEDRAEAKLESVETSSGKEYYLNNCPQVDSEERLKVTQNGDRSADLRDFDVVVKEKRGDDYTVIYSALDKAGAFTYLASGQLKVGDAVSFRIDPNFVKYKDKDGVEYYNILIVKEKGRPDGGDQILGVLPLTTADEFSGLTELRNKMLREFNAGTNVAEDGTYTFPKKSRVWLIRNGVMWFNSDKQEFRKPAENEVPIQKIAHYSEDAPIVFVKSGGNGYQEIRNVTAEVEENISPAIHNVPAGLYYLAKQADGTYIPIHLNSKHYNAQTLPANSPIRRRLWDVLRLLFDTSKFGDKQYYAGVKNQLDNILYLKGITFWAGKWPGDAYPSIRIARIIPGATDASGKPKSEYVNQFDLAPGYSVEDGIKQIETHLIAHTEYHGPMLSVTDQSTEEWINMLIDADCITANLNDFYARGAVFYTDSYDPEADDFMFSPDNEAESEEESESAGEAPDINEIAQRVADEFFGASEFDEADYMVTTTDLRGYEGLADLESEFKWLDRVLPQLTREGKVKLINGLITAGRHGEQAYGKVSRGIMTISDKAVRGTVYHEAFHEVFDYILDQKQRDAILNEAYRIYGTRDIDSITENLANDFREWMIKGGEDRSVKGHSLGARILDFFRNLFNMVVHYRDYMPYTQRIFAAINNADFARLEDVGPMPVSPDVAARINGLNDPHFKVSAPEGAVKVWEYGKKFDQKHIDEAIAALQKAERKGAHFDMAGHVGNIYYSPKTGFTFTGVTNDATMYGRGSKNGSAANRFKAILGETGMNYDYLPADVKSWIAKEGWTPEEYDPMTGAEKQQVLLCAGIV